MTAQANTGQKLNQSSEPAAPAAIWLFVCTGALYALITEGVGGSSLTTLVAFVWIISLCVLVFRLFANATHATRQAMALRTLPSLPQPVADPANLFDDTLEPVSRSEPSLDGNILAILDNQRKIKDHLTYLSECEEKAGAAMAAAIQKYRTDAAVLEEQQLALTRMGHQANTIMQRIESDFPRIKAQLTAVPEPPVVPKLQAPTYMNSTEYARFSKSIAHGTHHGLSRSAGALGQGDWRMALVGLTITAAMNVIQYQKAVRAMHSAHATVCVFVTSAKKRLVELGTIHATLRARSRDLHEQNTQLHGLLTWFNNNGDLWERKGALNGPTLDKVKQLARHAQLHALAARRKL